MTTTKEEFNKAFDDSCRLIFVLTRHSEDISKGLEVQLYDRDASETVPAMAGMVHWDSLIRLYNAVMMGEAGSIFIPAFTTADVTAYKETGVRPAGLRAAPNDTSIADGT